MMVKLPRNTSNLFYLIIFCSIYVVSGRPQSYDENLSWRSQPQIENYNNNHGNYPYQRYYQPSESQSARPAYYDSYGYHRPRIEPDRVPLYRPRVRGPKEALPVPEVKSFEQNEFNSTYAAANQPDRTDRRFELSNKKETTRILNSKPGSNGEMFLNEQTADFYFPGHVNIPNRTLITTQKSEPAPTPPPGSNPYVPDVSKIMKMCNPEAIFCPFAENYPADHIKSFLNVTGDNFKDLFGRDEIASNVSISTRIDVTIDGTPMCASKEQVIEPPVGRTKDNQWKFIVNAGPYVQGIRVEMCEQPGGPCAMSDGFPNTYTTECKQKYIYRKLLALEANGQIEPDNFRLPSCCTCIYRQDIYSRLGIQPAFGTSARK